MQHWQQRLSQPKLQPMNQGTCLPQGLLGSKQLKAASSRSSCCLVLEKPTLCWAVCKHRPPLCSGSVYVAKAELFERRAVALPVANLDAVPVSTVPVQSAGAAMGTRCPQGALVQERRGQALLRQTWQFITIGVTGRLLRSLVQGMLRRHVVLKLPVSMYL